MYFIPNCAVTFGILIGLTTASVKSLLWPMGSGMYPSSALRSNSVVKELLHFTAPLLTEAAARQAAWTGLVGRFQNCRHGHDRSDG